MMNLYGKPITNNLFFNSGPFTEIMQMIWKRLNDHGKNWRHVYKALVLLEYLIKTGSEKVRVELKRLNKNYENEVTLKEQNLS